MASHVALLRAVNVAGHAMVSMSDLRDVFTQLGLSDVRSLLQSGNLVFDSSARAAPRLERLLETELRARLALQTDVFVRTAEQWRAVVANNPCPDEAARDPSHLLAVFLKDAPGAPSVKALQAAVVGPEIVKADGQQLYIVYPNGIGRSRLTSTLIEKKLGTRATGRNWNTVLKLAALVG